MTGTSTTRPSTDLTAFIREVSQDLDRFPDSAAAPWGNMASVSPTIARHAPEFPGHGFSALPERPAASSVSTEAVYVLGRYRRRGGAVQSGHSDNVGGARHRSGGAGSRVRRSGPTSPARLEPALP